MFTQWDEEKYILQAVRGASTGRLLDIGAADGLWASNSRALMLKGWHGVFVEPAPSQMAGLAKLYEGSDKATIIQAAIVPTLPNPPLMTLQYHPGMVSSLSEAHKKKWEPHAKGWTRIEVHPINVNWLCHAYGPFDMMTIDAEDLSASLFMAMEHALFERVQCLVIEHDDRMPEIQKKAAILGFETTYWNGTNLVMRKAQ
jgi:hypothetical protein